MEFLWLMPLLGSKDILISDTLANIIYVYIILAECGCQIHVMEAGYLTF